MWNWWVILIVVFVGVFMTFVFTGIIFGDEIDKALEKKKKADKFKHLFKFMLITLGIIIFGSLIWNNIFY